MEEKQETLDNLELFLGMVVGGLGHCDDCRNLGPKKITEAPKVVDKLSDLPEVPLICNSDFSLSVKRCRRVGHQIQTLDVFSPDGQPFKINEPVVDPGKPGFKKNPDYTIMYEDQNYVVLYYFWELLKNATEEDEIYYASRLKKLHEMYEKPFIVPKAAKNEENKTAKNEENKDSKNEENKAAKNEENKEEVVSTVKTKIFIICSTDDPQRFKSFYAKLDGCDNFKKESDPK